MAQKLDAFVLSVNRVLGWCALVTHTKNGNTRKYTCSTKIVNGETFFYFKKAWHPLIEYVRDYTFEVVGDSSGLIHRAFRK